MRVDPKAPDHRGRRRILDYGAIAATVPYLVLKVLWLSGNLVGVPADSPATGEEFVYANAITLRMDAVVVLLALVLTHQCGATPTRRSSAASPTGWRAGRSTILGIAPPTRSI